MNADAESPGGTTRVASCQLAPRVGEAVVNLAANIAAIEAAARAGAQIVVLPELAATGYAFADASEARTVAEPLPDPGSSTPLGPTVTSWAEAASRLGVTVAGGLVELGADGVLFNSAVIVGAAGVLARYRKAHLWDREKLIFTPGDGLPPVIEVGGARVGLMVCYDVEFPEFVRVAALAGVDLLVVPANWPAYPRPDGERPMEIVRVQAAASANRMFVAVADRHGSERGLDWVGGSVIVGPDGWPLAGPDPGDHPLTLLADCALGQARAKSISDHNDVLADRRPALYAPILQEAQP